MPNGPATGWGPDRTQEFKALAAPAPERLYLTEHDVLAKHSGELITGNFYNGVWNLHGDAKATAIDRLLAVCGDQTSPEAVLQPTATHQAKAEHSGQQNPKLTLGGEASDFYLYQS